MKEVILYILKSIAKHPEEVVVDVVKDAKTTIFNISVNPDDRGRVIGKNGKIISSVKTIVNSLSSKEDGKIIIKVGEING
jgi:predicted RNA-binding protein YlqC (UPF0109 family)